MAGTLHRLSNFLLKFQACTGKPSGKYLALFIDKFQEEIRVFIVNVLNAILLEAAVLGFDLGPFDGLIH